ncbi:MAG TPA: MFS transporter [Candidatus Limnocylindrales bacterium]|nr:MFS transporter [Candidatus Limnocylindrales bacterium]
MPGFPRAILGTAVQRTGGQMLQVAIVLFVLAKFHSPALAGITVFLQIFPGLLVSPIAGALLDRYGRVRLMLLDFTVAAVALALIAFLSLNGRLSVPLLLVLVTISSLTSILTITGLRSLFPLIVPRHLWDRANGLDSSLYAGTTIIGPPLAAGIVALRGGEAALLVTAACFALAAVVMAGIREPRTGNEDRGTIWREAWNGLRYVARNRTLRGLALSISLVNLGTGGLVVSLPVLILNRLHAGPAAVGLVFGAFGVAALLSALIFGRIGSVNRERTFLAGSMLVTVVALVILAFAQNIWLVYGAAILEGTFIGAQDIGLFSIRQRRTDPAWFGRAFAVSMSLNYMGAPFGSAISGTLVGRSIALAFLVGAAFNLIAAATTLLMIPATAD